MTPGDRRLPARIWARVAVQANGCWLWTGGTDGRRGYGRVWYGGTTKQAHRVTYEALIGPIPDGQTIDHLCRATSCVNPRHMDVVPTHVNTLRSEGITAVQARQDQCLNGHPFTAGNTYRRSGRPSERSCRECHRQRVAAYRLRKKVAR